MIIIWSSIFYRTWRYPDNENLCNFDAVFWRPAEARPSHGSKHHFLIYTYMVDLLSVFQLVKSRAAYGSVNKLLEFLNIYVHLVSFSQQLYFQKLINTQYSIISNSKQQIRIYINSCPGSASIPFKLCKKASFNQNFVQIS